MSTVISYHRGTRDLRLSLRAGGTGRLLESRNGGLGRRLPKDEDDGGAHWCESEPQRWEDRL